jgi:hypothetical protein
MLEALGQYPEHSLLRSLVPVLAGPVMLLVSTCVLFGQALWPPAGQALFGVDLWYQFEPWWRFWAEHVHLHSGGFPLWNPHSLLGAPFLANPQVALAYPPNWLFLLVPLRFALGWGAAFHVALAAIGMYLFAGSAHAGRWGRTVAGFSYAFSSIFVLRLYAGHYSLVAVASWFPWLLYVGLRVCRRVSFTSVVSASAVLALTLLAGSPQLLPVVVGFAGIACLVWTLHRPTAKAKWRSLVGLSLASLLAVPLVAVQLISLLELVLHSSRATGSTYEFATSFSLMWQSFVTIVAPDLFNMVAFWEFHLFAGVISILLTIVAFVRSPRRILAWFGIAVAALLVAFGDKGGLYPILHRIIPWLGLLRGPARFSVVYFLSVSILAGIGIDSLLESAHSSTRVILLGMVLGLVVIAAAVWTDGTLATDATPTLVIYDSVRWCSLAGLLCLADWAVRRPRRQVLGMLVVALVALDMLSQGSHFIQVRSLEPEPRWQRIDAALPGERNSYRLLTVGELDHNQSLSLGFYGVGGYDPLIVSWAQDMVDVSLEFKDAVLDVLSVRYVVHDVRLPNLQSKAHLVIQSDDLFIYERSGAMPRVFSVGQYELTPEPLFRLRNPTFNPREQVLLFEPPACVPQREPGTDSDALVIHEYQPDYVRIEADLGAQRLVVLNDLWYPGWEAMVDGNPVNILRANHALRAVCVPAGVHTIEFHYRPWWVLWGAGVSAAFWGAVLLYTCSVMFRSLLQYVRQRENVTRKQH